jgi:hypothetical protein
MIRLPQTEVLETNDPIVTSGTITSNPQDIGRGAVFVVPHPPHDAPSGAREVWKSRKRILAPLTIRTIPCYHIQPLWWGLCGDELPPPAHLHAPLFRAGVERHVSIAASLSAASSRTSRPISTRPRSTPASNATW